MSDAVDLRLELAKALRELADGSNEAALRNALSRSYYSIFHAANVLLGNVSHSDVVRRVAEVDAGFEQRVERLQQLRSLADYDPGTGAPRFAVLYPVDLRSGEGEQRIWVEVTTLASMAFERYKVNEKDVVAEFVAEQLSKGGASYWDPQRRPRLEINGDRAEYVASRRSRARQ